MGFSLVQTATPTMNGNTITFGSALTVGNLVVVHAKWENSKNNIAATDGTTALALGTRADSDSADGVMSQFAYYLAVPNAGKTVITVTFPAGHVAGTRTLTAWEFDYDAAGGNAQLDTQAVGDGTTGPGSSANATTTGSTEIVFGGTGLWSGSQEPIANMQVAGTAATGTSTASDAGYPDSASWYKVATLSNQNVSCTYGGNSEWTVNLIAFKEAAAGGVSLPVVTETLAVAEALD